MGGCRCGSAPGESCCHWLASLVGRGQASRKRTGAGPATRGPGAAAKLYRRASEGLRCKVDSLARSLAFNPGSATGSAWVESQAPGFQPWLCNRKCMGHRTSLSLHFLISKMGQPYGSNGIITAGCESAQKTAHKTQYAKTP